MKSSRCSSGLSFQVLSTAAMLGVAAFACACAAKSNGPPSQATAVKENVVLFSGSAEKSASSRCANLIPPGLAHPFTPAGHELTVRDYRMVECWTGVLDRKKFQLATYFSAANGAGLAIAFGGALKAHLQIGSGSPSVVRFSGENVCIAEKAGAYFVAANLKTGQQMDERRSQDFCPPSSWPPPYVLGLGREKIPVR